MKTLSLGACVCVCVCVMCRDLVPYSHAHFLLINILIVRLCELQASDKSATDALMTVTVVPQEVSLKRVEIWKYWLLSHKDPAHQGCNEGPLMSCLCFCVYLTRKQSQRLRVITHSRPAFRIQIFRGVTTIATTSMSCLLFQQRSPFLRSGC